MSARASPSGFNATYNFSILLTCGFAFRHESEVHERSCITHMPEILLLKGYGISKILYCSFLCLLYKYTETQTQAILSFHMLFNKIDYRKVGTHH